ncbi:penicillin-binding protein 2 [soil metagenome]
MLRLSDPSRRLTVGMAAVLAVLVVLGGRLIQLQALDGTAYAAAAEQARLVRAVLPAERGAILARDGTPLAYSVQARAIFADPALVEQPARTALALAPFLDLSTDELIDALTEDNRFVYLARALEPSVAAQIMDLGLPGIGEQPELKRIYPAGEIGAQVVGFTGREGEGLAGIENQFEDLLRGTPGQISYERGTSGYAIPAGHRAELPAVPGSDVRLTLDHDLQYRLQDSIDAAMDGGVSTLQAVVLDARTGQVLAMGASPGYDSAAPGSADPDLLGNPTVSSVLEPGSVNKVVTMAAALDQGLFTTDSVLTVPDSIPIADIVVRDAWGHAPIDYTTTGILAKSSNVGTLMIAEQLGNETLEHYLRGFGLGSRTGIELPGESPGILVPHEEWSGSQAGNIPIGQGISMTALQMASMYQAIANDGVRVPPSIVAETVAADGTVTPWAPTTPNRVISESAAADLQYMLEAVVGEGGTASMAVVDGYRVAGKTGTAQRPNPACRCYSGGGYWATFAGFAPADDPRYVISVTIEQPDGGRRVAGPIFQQIMSYALQQNGVAPSGSPRPDFRLVDD